MKRGKPPNCRCEAALLNQNQRQEEAEDNRDKNRLDRGTEVGNAETHRKVPYHCSIKCVDSSNIHWEIRVSYRAEVYDL